MLRKVSPRHALRRSPVGNRGEIKMEYVFAGVLAVIILVSLVLAIKYGFGGAEQAEIEAQRYKCDACGELFVPSGPVPDAKQSELGSLAPPPIDCEKCGAKKSAYLTTKCPKCGEYFVRETYRDPMAIFQGRAIKDVCPHCGLDLAEYRAEQIKKARQERENR